MLQYPLSACHVSLDDVVKIEFGQNILDIGREPSQIVPEVGFDVIRVSQQLFKCELAGIVELITGSLGQKAINDGQLLDLFILCQDCFVGRKQTVVETLNHGHRKDYKSIFMGLNGPRSISATFQIIVAFSAIFTPTAWILSLDIVCTSIRIFFMHWPGCLQVAPDQL